MNSKPRRLLSALLCIALLIVEIPAGADELSSGEETFIEIEAPIETEAPVVTGVPVVTEAPIIFEEPVVTDAPEAGDAPTAAPEAPPTASSEIVPPPMRLSRA